MSDDPKPMTIADHAKVLLADGTNFSGMSDAEIKRHVVKEMLDCGDDASDSYVFAAFNAMKNGGDNRFAQMRRAERKRQQAALAAAPVVGGTN